MRTSEGRCNSTDGVSRDNVGGPFQLVTHADNTIVSVFTYTVVISVHLEIIQALLPSKLLSPKWKLWALPVSLMPRGSIVVTKPWRNLDAELLLKLAFSHSRMRWWWFGAVTKNVSAVR
jgi:hypothetical protein